MTLPFPVPAELFPVTHRFVDLDGARIHYVDEGSGEPLLPLHGNPAWSFLYRKIIATLGSDFRFHRPCSTSISRRAESRIAASPR
jgi:haloalkane dehalogenase